MQQMAPKKSNPKTSWIGFYANCLCNVGLVESLCAVDQNN